VAEKRRRTQKAWLRERGVSEDSVTAKSLRGEKRRYFSSRNNEEGAEGTKREPDVRKGQQINMGLEPTDYCGEGTSRQLIYCGKTAGNTRGAQQRQCFGWKKRLSHKPGEALGAQRNTKGYCLGGRARTRLRRQGGDYQGAALFERVRKILKDLGLIHPSSSAPRLLVVESQKS